MRKLIFSIITVLTLEAFLSNCANPTPPTGGKKDTIPPKLINSFPEDQTLNFKGQTITLTFDENINTDKLKQNLIITPTTEIKYKALPKKQSVTLKFEEPFEDSTTYTLNFFAGITDITEKNPAENLIIAFSTTNYIDSLEIYGKITDLYFGKPQEKMTVGLYRLTDTLNLTSVKPTYFITTNEEGAFRIQNIKQNPYRLLAFKDENKNLLFDPASETYAFLDDTIHLSESIPDSIRLQSISINASPLTFISARPSGRYFEVRYSKPIINYNVSFPENTTGPASNFSGESESIRFYNNLNLSKTDSIRTYLTVYDSLKNSITDTLHIKFRESSRKPTEYKASISPGSGTITEQTKYKIKFNKPTRLIADSIPIYIPFDTLFNIYVKTFENKFNFNHTEYTFNLSHSLHTFLIDTLEELKLSYQQTDTLSIDTTKYLIHRQLERIKPNSFTLQFPPNLFVSVEEDTLKTLSGNYKFANPDDYGSIKVEISTDKPSYTVQLMSKENVAKSIKNCSTCNFNQVLPGNYWIRILVDENNDGTWSPGNFLKLIRPEPVIHFREESALRSNWQIELKYSF